MILDHLPHIALLVILILKLGGDLVRHGEWKDLERYNFWTSLLVTLIMLGLLWWGGWFRGLL